MFKIITITAALLLSFSNTVFAENHASEALKHANMAVAEGKAGKSEALVDHAGKALEHTLAGALVAKGTAKNHLEAGAKELEEAIDHGNLNHAKEATKHAESAIEHIQASK
ncbi:MAG: small metal-binding protein SmbP [Methylococcaceae bacterium]|jgi:hypothetical protein